MGSSGTHKKSKMTFIQFCEREKIEYRTSGNHTRSGWIQIDCVFCGPGTGKFHMGFNLIRPRFSCWRCGGHKSFETMKLLTGRTPADIHGIWEAFPKEKIEDAPNVRGNFTMPKGVKPMARCHRDYLRSRRFNPNRIEAVWNVGGIEINGGQYKWRLYIPIISGGIHNSWTTRTIATDPDVTRYLSAPPEFERIGHKELLYGEDFAGETIIIVEGPMDAWRIGPGAVCTFGTRPTPAQIIRMGRYPKRYVCFDHGAERYSQALVEALSVFPGVTHSISLEASDPDSMGKKELSQVRRLLQ